jgi:hypothetical protein
LRRNSSSYLGLAPGVFLRNPDPFQVAAPTRSCSTTWPSTTTSASASPTTWCPFYEAPFRPKTFRTNFCSVSHYGRNVGQEIAIYKLFLDLMAPKIHIFALAFDHDSVLSVNYGQNGFIKSTPGLRERAA